MLIYGFHAVTARLRLTNQAVDEVYVDSDRFDGRMRDLLNLCRAKSVPVHQVKSARLDAMCPQRKHQGVVAKASGALPAVELEDLFEQLKAREQTPFLLLLDGVTDPRNLGACLRVADGAGVHAVIAPKDKSCQLTDIAVQTASGAAESVPYIQVTNLARTIDQLQEENVWVYGAADASGQTPVRLLYELSVPQSVAWILGAEGTGLRRLTLERCDELVSIPMAGQVSSLNVSVAAGIVLYETMRQRSFGVKGSL